MDLNIDREVLIFYIGFALLLVVFVVIVGPEFCGPILFNEDFPERPADVTEASAVEYVNEYAKTTVWNEQFTGKFAQEADLDIKHKVLKTTKDGYIIHVEVEIGFVDCFGTHPDDAEIIRDYFVNSTMLVSYRVGPNGYHYLDDHPNVSKRDILQNGTVEERFS